MTEALRASAFRGDPDVDELHSFFLPDHHFDGDTLWSFGTSLKSAYVNTFEFMNHAPVLQLWRDADGGLQAVSRISLGTGEWFHLATPAYRSGEVANELTRQADAAFALLTDIPHWHTVRYETKVAEIAQLEQSGYGRNETTEVYMLRSLEDPIAEVSCPSGIQIRALELTDERMLHERAMAQIDAFSPHGPTAAEAAWINRSLPHQLGYGRGSGSSAQPPHVIAVDDSGTVVAFADVFCDHTNLIGEFEPVGTRTSSQRLGLSKAVMLQGLNEMRESGMTQAVVRTGFNNTAAIAAYESVGFETTDHLIRFRKAR